MGPKKIGTCCYLDCTETVMPSQIQLTLNSNVYCEYHSSGGIFNGESYEQYQIIEQDFIDFIKVIPLAKEHFNVYSPILRDIIIRTCVQIEIFFKEWSKEYCSEYIKDNPLLDKYNSLHKDGTKRGVKSWSIGDYFTFKSKMEYNSDNVLHVMPTNIYIYPFETWTSEKNPPDWWVIYNSIKHEGSQKNKSYTLKVALTALGALYLLHCANDYSHSYLRKFKSNTISSDGHTVSIIDRGFTTPIDSQKYLFKLGEHKYERSTELHSEAYYEMRKRIS